MDGRTEARQPRTLSRCASRVPEAPLAADRRLADLLSVTDNSAGDRARALLIASAVHNLGAPRTINLPSLPLEMLHPRHESQFTITALATSAEAIGGCRGQRLDLSETGRPTLVQRPAGGDMPSRISAWIEEGSWASLPGRGHDAGCRGRRR